MVGRRAQAWESCVRESAGPLPLHHAAHGGGAAPSETDAEAGMAEMSEKFREKGSEVYLPAAE